MKTMKCSKSLSSVVKVPVKPTSPPDTSEINTMTPRKVQLAFNSYPKLSKSEIKTSKLPSGTPLVNNDTSH